MNKGQNDNDSTKKGGVGATAGGAEHETLQQTNTGGNSSSSSSNNNNNNNNLNSGNDKSTIQPKGQQNIPSLPMNLTSKGKSIGSNSSNGGSGNNSDNSGLISIGNASFGFNFDSEEGTMNNSPRNSDEGDSDGSGNGNRSNVSSGNKKNEIGTKQGENKQSSASTTATTTPQPVSIIPKPTLTPIQPAEPSSHSAAAAAAVANLQSIASICTQNARKEDNDGKQDTGQKRKAQDKADNDSAGYNSDDEGRLDGSEAMSKRPSMDHSVGTTGASTIDSKGGSGKKKKLDDFKREERNAREKERSFRISRQINELRNLLSNGGVIVPKGTKSSVLTEAANYIRMLQQHQYRSEIDRHQLVQQIQMIGGGALGQQAATAVRHVAAQNGVWSLGNFGGVPPKSAMMYYQPGAATSQPDGQAQPQLQQQQQNSDSNVLQNKIETHEYQLVFNSCAVGMAIASMGGAFIECNKLFCQLSNYTKQEVCSMTIFNLTARQDLQHAFDLISQMLSAPTDNNNSNASNRCVLRGAMKNRNDLGLSIALIKGDDGIAKCFCVTLITNPTSPFDTSRPVPATADFIQPSSSVPSKDSGTGNLESTPAYTTG